MVVNLNSSNGFKGALTDKQDQKTRYQQQTKITWYQIPLLCTCVASLMVAWQCRNMVTMVCVYVRDHVQLINSESPLICNE